MWELLTASENLAFSVSLTVMLIIAVLEGVLSVLGTGLSGTLDALLPELDVDLNPHAEVGLSDAEGALSRWLGWLRIGEVPVLMLLIVALTAFGLIGFALQSLARHSVGFFLPGWIAVMPAAVLSLPAVRVCGGWLHRFLPRDETTAVSADSLVGQIAIVVMATARRGAPAEAKARDIHGQTHYFLVEPDQDGQEFPAGTEVLLLERRGTVYQATINTHPHLSRRNDTIG